MLNNQERAEFINKNKEIILKDLNNAKSYEKFIDKYSDLFNKYIALKNETSWKDIIINAMQISMIPQSDKQIASTTGLSIGTVYSVARGRRVSEETLSAISNIYPSIVCHKTRKIEYIPIGGWIQLNYHVGDVVDVDLVKFIAERGTRYKYPVQYNDEDIFMVETLELAKILEANNTCIINIDEDEEQHYEQHSNESMYDGRTIVKLVYKESDIFVMGEN